ncbi:hypothetical protein [uncultured Clostridium sp.]|uniref:hypothetical protein n=1 Tax=uncultured Clostridium sp. TaxID=59620 RepID=UPI00345DC067
MCIIREVKRTWMLKILLHILQIIMHQKVIRQSAVIMLVEWKLITLKQYQLM